jgi:hypothetical protein
MSVRALDVTLANPLGANLDQAQVTPVAFSLTDGVQTFTETTPGVSGTFQFSTDAFANITAWQVLASNPNPFGPNVIETNNRIDNVAITDPILGVVSRAFNCDMPGIWTNPSATEPVPEPPTVSLLGVGLLRLGLLWCRRRQKLNLAP